MAVDQDVLKVQVKDHWERETCGTRYGENQDRKTYFDQIATARYELEPYIPGFADFPSGRGRSILEIGVGAGSDFANWCAHADHATGIDLTERAIALTTERLQLNGVDPSRYTLRTTDAENLPFADASFDLVYSWGVLHHSPRTERAFQEVFRVLRPGGTIRVMIYHAPSWVGWQLYLLHGLARGKPFKSVREICSDHLESPGTKVYSRAEARTMVEAIGFRDVTIGTLLAPGDLLTIKLSGKYQSPVFRLIQACYPRWLIRMLGHRFGLNLTIVATKPAE